MTVRRSPLIIGAIIAALGCSFASTADIPAPVPSFDSSPAHYADQAVSRLSRYIQVDTVNPPGNEARAVEFFRRIFDAEGIDYQIFETAPGRSNIVARLEGGDQPGLLLLNHTDVVPFEAENWDRPPLSGAVVDGVIHGRGALDMKGIAIMQLQAFLALHHSAAELNRDVLFVAAADEEAGGNLGAGFLVKNHPELFKDIGFALNEGGGGRLDEAGNAEFRISVTEKIPFWFRVTATGEPGHGSVPQPEPAVGKLLTALNRLQQSTASPRVSPVVREYLKQIAAEQSPDYREAFSDIDRAIADEQFMARLRVDHPRIAASLTNTCSITRLSASNKINVIPNEAWAEVDCRMLPDQNKQAFVDRLHETMATPGLEIEEVLSFAPATSTMDSALYQHITDFLAGKYPEARILPTMTTGFTDSHWFREMGIESYGFMPTLAEPDLNGGFHGNNERISVANLKTATVNTIELLKGFVSD